MSPRKEKGSRASAGIRITWRYILVSTVIVLFASRIAYVMFSTTVVDADKWIEKANKELQRRDTIMPLRGDILSADGSVLATNLHYYTMRMDFKASKFSEDKFRAALDSLCDTLAFYHPVRTRDEWHAYISKELDKEPKDRSRCFTLLRNLSHSESEAVKQYPFFKHSRNPNRNGLTVESIMRRSYPYGAMARRSIGRTGQTKQSKEVHGRSGLEYALDAMLYGKPGIAKKVPLTHNIVNWTDIPPVNGMTLTTTIDVSMQDIVEHELVEKLKEIDAEWGTVILMDVQTGDIKAISNLERDTEGSYIESMNHAIQGFEPGSVMKAISMVIALEDGFVKDPENEFYNIGASFVFGGGSPIRDTHSPGSLPVSRFLEYSSNIGMTKLVAPHFKDDPNKFRERLAKLGFFEPLNTGIAGERPPYFPPLDIKAGGLVSLGRQTYGYASQIPPLYICAFYNAIANNGRFVRPRLVSKITTERGDSLIPVSYIRDRMCSPQTAATVREMLHRVIYGEGGTAKRLRDDLVDIAGKTGTSKVAREISNKDREKSRINPNDSSIVRPKGYEENAYRFSFCGFFPYDNPRYTCMVMVSRPRNGHSAQDTSGKVVLNIARRMYSHGMLGDAPDFRLSSPSSQSPVFYATCDPERDRNLKSMVGSNSARRLPAPARTDAGRIPDVRGLGLREAIVQIERAGFNIIFDGDGTVLTQSPAPGTPAAPGTKVSLVLQKS
ncbi:MAG: transpeptidase family protein [Muribaculaceae bacterium]|nr:transpeptidase family protein [Muribaculaceae bacterium]